MDSTPPLDAWKLNFGAACRQKISYMGIWRLCAEIVTSSSLACHVAQVLHARGKDYLGRGSTGAVYCFAEYIYTDEYGIFSSPGGLSPKKAPPAPAAAPMGEPCIVKEEGRVRDQVPIWSLIFGSGLDIFCGRQYPGFPVLLTASQISGSSNVFALKSNSPLSLYATMLPTTTLSSIHSANVTSTLSLSPLSTPSISSSSASSSSSVSLLPSSPGQRRRLRSFCIFHGTPSRINPRPKGLKVNCSVGREPLKVMISGAPASGKGTQCELIVQKFGLVHISTGDLLRAEISTGTEIGNKAKEFMNAGRLVPDEIVTAMVTTRLSCEDAIEKGWLLDGYPRSFSQAQSLEKLKIRPAIYIVLDVPDEILIDRCIGRRLDPVTGKIYHLKNFPPETEEINARLIIRPDDTEEKVKSRLQIYNENAEAISSTYSNIMNKINGNRPKEEVFKEIQYLLLQVQEDRMKVTKSGNSLLQVGLSALGPVWIWTPQVNTIPESKNLKNLAAASEDNWRGIPTRLNNIPHSREIRKYFYTDVLEATQRAINDGRTRLKVEINIPELNPEMDVYRIGTLMELARVLALSFANDGKRVKVCVQGSMGEGARAGMPLQLAGTRQILEFMDWGDYDALGTFVKIGSVGAKEVDEQDDIFVLVAPQNAVGNCIIDDLKADDERNWDGCFLSILGKVLYYWNDVDGNGGAGKRGGARPGRAARGGREGRGRRCKSYERAKKKLTIMEAPNIKILALKRFRIEAELENWVERM
ncbi:Adenylate kinase 2, chloroplastic [Morella rubra]|uniref:adenylate kinase n=1 Tax=Morella rubra TaxID=262757 RepID=A0A6A1VGN9_9ROSI|nr:Adenylate kinase 2, chloroplastic [Morella rubra]